MKRFLLISLLTACIAAQASAQASADTAVLSQPTPLMQFHPEQGALRLEVAGYGITLNSRDNSFSDGDEHRHTNPRRVRCSFGLGSVEMGFNILTTPDYGTIWNGDGDFLETKAGKSFHFAFQPLQLRIRLDDDSRWWLRTGIGFAFNDYVFAEHITLRRIDGIIRPEGIDNSFKKSKLNTSYLSIPLGITFTPVEKLNITLRATGDLLLGSHTKYKKPKHKNAFSGLSPWCWRIGGMISYHRIGLYADYSLTRLFRESAGPETHAVSVGLYFGF